MKATKRGTQKHRQLPEGGYSQRVSAEQREYARACAPPRMAETDITDARRTRLLEKILDPENLNRAAQHVIRKKGAGGIDGMQVQELSAYLDRHQEDIVHKIRENQYRPQPVRRKEIKKENGKMRKLGIPTVVDRWIQQAVSQVLSPIFEEQFSEYSYGFRPRRSAHDALRQCQANINDGYNYVVDMDLEKYFDTVNQSKLMQLLANTIHDGRVLKLIQRFLHSGIIVDGMFEESEEGVPQGGPLSPLLGNVMLNECDQELTRRGHRFVRYADDMQIFCRSRKAAQRTLEKILPFIEGKLFLRVNREKTQVAYITKVKFLGYGFYKVRGEARLRAHPTSVQKLKDKLRDITARSNGIGIEERRRRLNQLIRGWINYFCLADIKTLMTQLDSWIRDRIRMITWKRWKRVRTRFANLKRLGVKENQAWQWANTRKSYWRTANSPILRTTLTAKRFLTQGYISLKEYYIQRHA